MIHSRNYHGCAPVERVEKTGPWTRELYQWPGIAPTINEHHIRDGYYGSMLRLNPTGIVPAGSLVDFSVPHGRG